MDSRDDDSLSSSLPSSLIPHLYTAPQDSSTRTTLSDDFPRAQLLPPLDPRLPPPRQPTNFDRPEPPPARNLSSSSPFLMDLAGAAVHQPAIPPPSTQRFGSPIYSDPVFHTSRPPQYSRTSSYPYNTAIRGDSNPSPTRREGEAGPSSLLPPRHDNFWPSPNRHPWREGDLVGPSSFLPSRDDPVWNQPRPSVSRESVPSQPAWISRQQQEGQRQEPESSANSSSGFTHFGHPVSASGGGERGASSTDMDKRYTESESYHDMALITPGQGSNYEGNTTSGPFVSSFLSVESPGQNIQDQLQLQYSYPPSQMDISIVHPSSSTGREPNTLHGMEYHPDSRFGTFSGHQGDDIGNTTDVSSQKGKKHRNTIEGREEGVRRPKTSVACDFCRGRKLRCDGEKPCSNCKGRGFKCVYVHFQRRRGPGKNPKGPRAKKRAAQAAAATTTTARPGGRPESIPSSTRLDTGSSMFEDLPPNYPPSSLHTFYASPPELYEFTFRLPSEAPRYPTTRFPNAGPSGARTPRSRETSSEDRSDAEEMHRKMG